MPRGPAFDVPRFGSYIFMGFGALIVTIGVVMAFDDPAGLFAVLFGAVFIGVGLLVRRLFSVPEGMRQIAVAEDVTTMAGAGGGRVTRSRTTIIQVGADATDGDVVAAKAAWLVEQWTRRPDWVEGLIVSDDARHGGMAYWGAGIWSVVAVGAWVAALVWGGAAWILAVGATAFGAAFAVAALRLAVRRRKFGESRFRIDRTPIAPGDRLTGDVHTGVRRATPLDERFTVALRCIHRWEETSGTGDNRRTQRHRDTLWEAEARHPGALRPGESALVVPVDFSVPADQPPITLGGGSEGILWELSVTAAVPGVDYSATFELPVLEPNTGDALRRPAPGA